MCWGVHAESGYSFGMNKGDLTDAQWASLQPLLPPRKPWTGRPNHDHRSILNGILWILRTGGIVAGLARAAWQTLYRLEPVLLLAAGRALGPPLRRRPAVRRRERRPGLGDAVLAVYSVQVAILALLRTDCQKIVSDRVNGQHMPSAA